ncbi:hypothetical protein N7533_003466 [Penicillium manginii]|uniref:uncharacterized protein n=1 Tax=Penicillium manginii TaxID=203109 RepID=UPI0025465CC3|nr:uncharacterized protein N7533_003466 [Penicillium manginii]KAJ5761427.1 hypothetical protein N7533_003466 [Penicillium manginii]
MASHNKEKASQRVPINKQTVTISSVTNYSATGSISMNVHQHFALAGDARTKADKQKEEISTGQTDERTPGRNILINRQWGKYKF